MTFMTIFLIYWCTFIGCNGKLQSNYKSGCIVTTLVVTLIFAVLGFLLG